jgi:1-acyl-sn-glycerol-3-phosphate acyltransferase
VAATPSKPTPAVLPRFDPGLRGLLQRLLRFTATLLLRLFVRLSVEGAPDFARCGPVLLAPNHCSFIDPPILQLAVRHHLTFLMTATVYRFRLLRWFFRLWGAIPVPDSGAAATALRQAENAIARGRPVVIFPEGRISDDGCLNEGRGGVAMLMMRAQVPVIPVAIIGTFHVLPRGRRWPRKGRVTVRFGAPIEPPRGGGIEPRVFAREVMARIAQLGVPVRSGAGDPAGSGSPVDGCGTR